MAKKIYVLDTSVYLTDAESYKTYGNNDIVVPLKVLEEIDKHKKPFKLCMSILNSIKSTNKT